MEQPATTQLPRPYVTFELGKSKFEVDSRYTNLKPIGRGAYGLVASAVDNVTGRKVAIKRVSRVFQDLIDAKRILREIKLLRHLGKHENIIELFDIMTTPPETEDFHTLYIVTSVCGEICTVLSIVRVIDSFLTHALPFTQLYECDLDRIISSSQKLTDQHAQYFIYQILRGLKYVVSANIIHRDLKPSNILVNSNCDLAICDFGLARGISFNTDFRMTEYVVTRWYRAPELLCDLPYYGTAVDIWSVGCIMAEIIGRKPMFRGSSTREQLELIVTKLGITPADVSDMPIPKAALEHIKRVSPDPSKVVPLIQLLPSITPLALDLLSRMLVFNPEKRISLEEAIAHPYLDQLRTSPEPVCRNTFDFTFEQEYPEEIPQYQLQRLMFEELQAMRRTQSSGAADKPAAASAPFQFGGVPATAAFPLPAADNNAAMDVS